MIDNVSRNRHRWGIIYAPKVGAMRPMKMWREIREYLAEKGFAVEDFGEGSIIVRTVPMTLKNLKGLSSILEDFAKILLDGNGLSFEERCDRALYTVACKAALKAGIKNSPEGLFKKVSRSISRVLSWTVIYLDAKLPSTLKPLFVAHRANV